MPKTKNSILSIFHVETNSSNDRNYQEFKLFVNNEKVRKEIGFLRLKRRIIPDNIKRKVEKYRTLRDKIDDIQERALEQAQVNGVDNDSSALFDIQEKYGFQKLENESRNYIDALHRDVNSKISIEDIEKILKKYHKPFSWVDSLSGYILTGVIRSPHSYEIRLIKAGVELIIFP